MNDLERFERVLEELSKVLLGLYTIGLADDVFLIGAQVVALEQRSRRDPAFRLSLPGIEVTRAFSMEPDLVIDTDDLNRLEGLPAVLRAQGFERGQRPGKPSRWTKSTDGLVIELDLFTTADCDEDELPTPMTRLRGASRYRLHDVPLTNRSTIKVPDAQMYLSLKLEAKLRIRPKQHKDSLDLFAYAKVVGVPTINAALESAGEDGERVRRELRQLFEREDSEGVQDVLAGVGQSMNEEERALLARAVLDAFEGIIS